MKTIDSPSILEVLTTIWGLIPSVLLVTNKLCTVLPSLSKWNIGTHGAFAPRASNKKVASRRDESEERAWLETIQSAGQHVLPPSFLPPSPLPCLTFFCSSLSSSSFVVSAILRETKIYLKRLAQRDLPAITSLSLYHCTVGLGLGLRRRGRTKSYEDSLLPFETNETGHLVFPTKEKVSFLILLSLGPY